MTSPSASFKGLGILGAAAIGLVPIGVLNTSAYAVSGASLTLAATAPGQRTSATTTFTVTNATPGGTTEYLTVTANSGEQLPAAAVDYSVTVGGVTDAVNTSYTGTGAFAVTNPNGVGNPPWVVTLPLTTAASPGQQVVVTITGVTNPSSNASVYFTDQASSDTSLPAANTNTVSVAGTAGAAATVTSVNPQAFAAATGGAASSIAGQAGFTAPTNYNLARGEQFTVMGSGFSTTGTAPTACFVPSTLTPLPNTCSGTGTVAVTNTAPVFNTANNPPTLTTPGTYALDVVSSTELQGIVSGLAAGKDYNVVVYNSGAAPSATSADTVVAVSGNTATVDANNDIGALNFVPESGVRTVDTRVGLGLPASPLTPGVAYYIPDTTFENSPAVPTNVPQAEAVALNVTATAPSGPGNLQVWSPSTAGECVAGSDAASTVNFQPPQDTNNSTIVPLGHGICVQDNGASVNVVMDVTGYLLPTFSNPTFYVPSAARSGAAPGPGSGTYGSRILDTRPGATDAISSIQGPLAGGTVYRFNAVAGSADATVNLTAGEVVALNVTAVGPMSAGNLRVFPEPSTGAPGPSGVPNTAADTYIPGVDGGSLVITTVGADGYIDLYSDSAGTVNVVIDEVGVFGAGSSVTGLTPVRMIDTRPGGAAAGGTTTFTAAPFAAIPTDVPSNALGVLGDLADIQPTSPGYLVAYPGGETMPGTANIANYPGQTRSTTAFAAVSPSTGMVSVSSIGASTNFTFDATGYVS